MRKYLQRRVFARPVRRPPRSRLVSGTALVRRRRGRDAGGRVHCSRYPSGRHWSGRLHKLLLQTQLCRVTSVRSYRPRLPKLGLYLGDCDLVVCGGRCEGGSSDNSVVASWRRCRDGLRMGSNTPTTPLWWLVTQCVQIDLTGYSLKW